MTYAEHHIEIEAEIGVGAFDRVYRARSMSLDIPVAVKVLHADKLRPHTEAMFAREARLMARLDHPNVLRVFEFQPRGPEGPFIVTEWMDGGALEGPVSDEEALRTIALETLSGLQALHRTGVVHRDIKPDNLLTRSDGRIKLGDLGIALEQPREEATVEDAKLTGTLPFMAPELFAEVPRYRATSDVYAVGVTLFALWSGELPFAGDSAFEMIHKICLGRSRAPLETLRPGLSLEMRRLIEHLMAFDPDHRPSTEAAIARLCQSPAPEDTARSSALPSVGPWSIVSLTATSTNWRYEEVLHTETGIAARLRTLRAGSSLPADTIEASARQASLWEHPGLTPVLDWGRDADDQPWLVMGRTGRSLDDIVQGSGPLSEMEALSLTAELADVIAYLHADGWAYQMVEPGSVFQSPRGDAFTLGWPGYCRPLGSESQGHRVFVGAYQDPMLRFMHLFEPSTDIFGIGAVLHFALTRQSVHAPLQHPTLLARAQSLRHTLPHITAPTLELTATLLAASPLERPQSALAVAERARLLMRRLSHQPLDAS